MKLLCIDLLRTYHADNGVGRDVFDVIQAGVGCVPRIGDNIDFSRKPCPKVRQVIWFPTRDSLADIGHEHTEADVILLCE